MSHSHIIRLNALAIITSPIIECKFYIGMINACLVAEAMPLNVQGARERAVLTSKVTRYSEGTDGNAASLCIRWLIGMS